MPLRVAAARAPKPCEANVGRDRLAGRCADDRFAGQRHDGQPASLT